MGVPSSLLPRRVPQSPAVPQRTLRPETANRSHGSGTPESLCREIFARKAHAGQLPQRFPLCNAAKCAILILYDLKKEVTTMKLQTRLAVLVCKASGAVLRRLGRGGTNLPGKLALKIDKNILGELSRGVKVTVVTGTNGKTTTSRMIGVRRCGTQIFLQQVRREPADRHHRGICTAFHAVRQMPVHARAHRVRRGSLPQNKRIPAGRMSGRQQHLPRPA